MTARVHGGIDSDELAAMGVSAAEVVDFSVNVNPYGPPAEVLAAVAAARLDRYPDTHCREARQALSRSWDVPAERIALGNGAAELLWSTVGLLCRERGGPLLVVEPTFCEPALAAAAAGAAVARVMASEARGFAIDLAAVISAAREVRPAAVYLCNPQNPTGRALPLAAVAELAHGLAPVPLILDEAFLAVSTRADEWRWPLPEHVLRVRSFTKELALPGLRLGALIGPAALVTRLEACRPAWTVSAPAQSAIIASAGLVGFVAELRSRWLADTRKLAEELTAIGLGPLPTDTVYLLCPVGNAAAVRTRLLREHQVLVRDATSFGLPHHLRLGGRPVADRRRLLSGLRAVLGH